MSPLQVRAGAAGGLPGPAQPPQLGPSGCPVLDHGDAAALRPPPLSVRPSFCPFLELSVWKAIRESVHESVCPWAHPSPNKLVPLTPEHLLWFCPWGTRGETCPLSALPTPHKCPPAPPKRHQRGEFTNPPSFIPGGSPGDPPCSRGGPGRRVPPGPEVCPGSVWGAVCLSVCLSAGPGAHRVCQWGWVSVWVSVGGSGCPPVGPGIHPEVRVLVSESRGPSVGLSECLWVRPGVSG